MGRRPVPDAHPLRRAPRVHGRAAVDRRRHLHVRDQGRRRLFGVQVRGRHPSRPAGPGDRVPGPHPHLDGDRRGAPRGRGRRGRDRSRRSPDRRLPQLGSGRSVGQHHRLGGADHPQADRDRRLDAGREVPAAEPRARDARAAGAAVRAGAGRAAGARSTPSRQAQVGTGERAEKIRTYNYREKRVKDHRINLLVAQPRRDPDGRARRADRRAAGRREAPALGGARRLPEAPVAAARDRSPVRALATPRRWLAAAGCDTPRLDAELLLAFGAGGRPRAAGADRRSGARRRRRRAAVHGAGGAARGARTRRLHPRA